ncbi:putative splicing factor 3A subunit 1 [Cardamine amara subsp. amara]|uniref:Splicing factor 3A subunit 1 n=1 Tax=Cardamine amara subsp. amara TaxID=228776 RepID=A0ABD0ZEL7_CARAN
MEYEKKYANYNINDARINFPRSTEDPLHGYYKQKLSEYLSQIEKHGAIVDDDDDDVASSQVIEPPPGIISNNIERMARYISKMGLVGERMMMQSIADNARYSFMWSSDPFHAFYKQKLTQYLFQNQPDAAAADAAYQQKGCLKNTK